MACGCQNKQGENNMVLRSNYEQNENRNSINNRGLFRPQMAIPVQSWQDLQVAPPLDPRMIFLSAALGSTVGTFTRSTNLLQSAWVASPLAFTGNNTKVASMDTTDAATSVDAAQWTLNHQMTNASAGIPPSLGKIAYVRTGPYWDNQLEINFGVSSYNNVQLTLRDNLGTSGMFVNGATGGIPAFSFGSGITGNQVLHLTLLKAGTYNLVIAMVLSSNWNAFEIELVAMP
jgi:hypothetical protein